MSNKRKILRRIAISILCVCTAYLMYDIISNPLGSHNIIFALAVAAGFIALASDKK